MLKNVIKADSSEEFLWAAVAASAPLQEKKSFEFWVGSYHGNRTNRNWICKLKPGIILSVMDLTTCNEVRNTISTKEEFLKFVFFLSGSGRVEYDFVDTRLRRDFSDGIVQHSYIYFSPEIEGSIFVDAFHRLYQLTIHVTPALLVNYLGGMPDLGPFLFRDILQGADNLSFFHTAKMSRAMLTAVYQILGCAYSGSMRNLFLESKAMELITYKIDQMIPSAPVSNKPPGLSKDAIARTRKAADFLSNNLENPPTLSQLAAHARTSHTRLNLDFKRIYGTTVFGYLRQVRLEKAKRLLEEDGFNVSQTAYEVGYNSIPSFSRAYSEYFGSSPKAHMR